ncbi:DUF4153 domain-containing protein [Caldicoprobacter guelmensis]|uniref:DUF4153 domain-containing protein n=1 Tax=Caldicoprobacter guelmensis TaxID=1170224 RepID=UPI0019567F5A
MDIKNFIIENIDRPRELEKMYRKDPEAFKEAFTYAWEHNPDSQVLAVWYERLYYDERREEVEKRKTRLYRKDFLLIAVLAVLAGISTRLILYFAEKGTIASVNLIFGVFPFIAAYFIYRNALKKSIVYTVAALFFVSAVYINLLPLKPKDSIILAYLHLPVFLWVLLGFAYVGNEHKKSVARLNYLKFNVEFIVLYASMAISGMLLALLTTQLFRFIGMDVSELYFENVVLFGAAALAVVAAYLVSGSFKLGKNIVPYLAEIFSPLFLVTLSVYLITVVWMGKNPFLDRNFLLSFNGILLGVLALTIFSIIERRFREEKNIIDYVNCALIFLALVIDSVALSAIVFRITSYGVTPNRLAVLGLNIVVYINLVWIMLPYIRYLKNKAGLNVIQDAIARYLPIYGLWAAFVTFGFPLIF